MTRTFCASARRLLRLAAVQLGWTPRTFWASTPAELADLFAGPEQTRAGLTTDELQSLLERDNANRSHRHHAD